MSHDHATIDFETYSEAGYVRTSEGKWKTVQKNKSSGIAIVGAWAYSEHPSTVIHCMSYSLPGQPENLWWPWMPPPLDLLEYLQQGGIVEAHNSFFEFSIWNNVAVPRLGWPALPLEQLRCSAAKSRAWGLPGALEKAVLALGLPAEKDMDGNRVMVSASKPRKATKKEPFERFTAENSPEKFRIIGEYCVQDVKAEKALSAAVPDLPASEQVVHLTDQRINARGIQCDVELLAACREVVRQATTRYTRELVEITGGAVSSASEAAKITGYCGGRGVYMPNMQEETVEATLERDDLPSDVRRVLEIRNYIGGASVKKLEAMHHRLGRDGRIRDLFVFCGATRTGRWAGAGVQPQNMVNKHPDIVACAWCKQIRWSGLTHCPQCGYNESREAEWGPDAIQLAMSHLKSRNLDFIEKYWGNSFVLVMGVLRSLFCAAPGKDLIGSDFSAIEAVVLAFMAGEEWRMEVFRTHGKIYEMSASKISGVPFDEIMRHKQDTGFDHPLRKKVGKVAELACFAPDTQVLTRGGYLSIKDIEPHHELWDGIQWVKSSGAIHKGVRKVINVDGVRVTPQHAIFMKNSWKEARQLASNPNTLDQALAIGSENLPSLSWMLNPQAASKRSGASARVVSAHTNITSGTFETVKAQGAESAEERNLSAQNTLNTIGSMPTPCRTKSTAGDFLTGFLRRLAAATILKPICTNTTDCGVSQSATNGVLTKRLFCAMSKPSKGGTIPPSKWTEKIQTAITSRETSVLSAGQKTPATKGASPILNNAYGNWSTVYDIVNAGPNSRFTIKTDSGHLIVHNSGYQGWTGAWKAFGADKFMDDGEMETNILAWRDASPMVVEFWHQVEHCAKMAIRNPGHRYSYRTVTYVVQGGVLYCILPSGRCLCYHKPRIGQKEHFGKLKDSIIFWGVDGFTKKWSEIETHGGKLTENIIQAVAGDIQRGFIVRAEAANYPIVLHVHDEGVAEVPEGWGSVEEFEAIMAQPMDWCRDWAVRAGGGWRGKFYRKG